MSTPIPGAPQARPLRLLLAGGGTAGHVEPALALADAVIRRHPDTVVAALGTAAGLETTLVPAHGFELHLIPKVTMPRSEPGRWLSIPSGMWSAVRTTAAVIAEQKPDVVVGFGGYVSLPAYLAARWAKVPFVVHEANAKAGVANRIGSRFTPYVAVSAPSTLKTMPHAALVGIPLRRSITMLDRSSVRTRARLTFGLEADLPTVLVFGGSQGAKTINEAMQGAARDLLDAGVQVIHAAGSQNTVVVERRHTDPPYVVVPYLERMDLAYATADLVVARSGAMTCAEIAALGLPAVFVPYPHSNGEQAVNAQPLLDAGAAIMVLDDDFSASTAANVVRDLVLDVSRLRIMSQVALHLGAGDADERLADMVVKAAGRS